ncbi:hypothetical protein N0V93_007120 [Gnomoniopsis smithogilvyi]|uniref:Apple domain-containing protein n=1 Tax=Gnomoniopsis smithogilvyi TaxID=1191159 RepID=A0A9W8YPH1_9PEZI|nr:hypothetical protein N0V93_007120 [Gnomoniopsis smithogilvyi]
MYKSSIIFLLVEAARLANGAITSSQSCTWVTYTIPDPIYPVCESDNCYNEMLDPRYNAEALAFCPNWLEGTPTTEAAAIPTYLENCQGSVEAVSSACTCIAWSITAAQVTGTSLPSVSLTVGSSAASPTSSSLLCPDTDEETIIDSNGVAYTIHCASDSTQGSYTSAAVANSYLDCMTTCDAASDTGCTAWAYTGTPGTGGEGSGTCLLKTTVGTILTGYDNFIIGVQVAGASSSSSPLGLSATTSTSATSTIPTESPPAITSTTTAIQSTTSPAVTQAAQLTTLYTTSTAYKVKTATTHHCLRYYQNDNYNCIDWNTICSTYTVAVSTKVYAYTTKTIT